jgi:sigma-B regulation protein RsbQ
MSAIRRNNVHTTGTDGTPILFSHGFGCDQNMWRFVAPAFADAYRVVLFDHVGAGASDLSAYDRWKYSSLDGYATDVLEICTELQLSDVVFVGHSVSAMIGVLAARKQPARFKALVLIGPSPRYINDGDYVGGFARADIEGLLTSLDSNYLGWSSAMAPVIMGNPDRPELGSELTNSFCRTPVSTARSPRTFSDRPYIGDESTSRPPSFTNSLSTARIGARATSDGPTSKVCQVPRPMRGSCSLVLPPAPRALAARSAIASRRVTLDQSFSIPHWAMAVS